MIVAVTQIELQVPHSRSLKAKRKVVRQVLDRVRAKFPVSAAEVGGQDLWQRTVLGFALVTSDWKQAEQLMDKLVRFVEEMYVAGVVSVRREVLDFEDFGIEPWDMET